MPKDWEAPNEKKDFPSLPEDTYQVFVEDVNLVKRLNKYNGQEEMQMNFTFSILGTAEEREKSTYRGRKLWKYVRTVISAGGAGKNPAMFNVIYEAIMRRTPYEDQVQTINAKVIDSLIGKQLLLVVKEGTDNQGKKYNTISDYMKAKTPMALPEKWSHPVSESSGKDWYKGGTEDAPTDEQMQEAKTALERQELKEQEEKTIDLKDIPF